MHTTPSFRFAISKAVRVSVVTIVSLLISFTMTSEQNCNNSYFPMTSRNGSALCATNQASASFQLVAAPASGPTGCVPGSAQCAWRCCASPGCVGYNVRLPAGLCQLFNATPGNLTNEAGCVYYQVGIISSCTVRTIIVCNYM